MLQRFLDYSVDPRQYRIAVGVNCLLGLAFAFHLIHGASRSTVAAVALGLVVYTFGEYAYHRWIAHGLLWRYQAVHHDGPDDRLITPPWYAGLLCVAVVWPALAALMNPASASGVFLGATVAHLYADLQHALCHRTATRGRLRAHHGRHHDDPTVNFGLTTRLWDRLFRTLAA